MFHYCLILLVIYTRTNANTNQHLATVIDTYYEPKSRIHFRATSFENMLINTGGIGNESLKLGGGDGGLNLKGNILSATSSPLQKIGFRSNGCMCQQLTCGCCLGINLSQFQINREGCMNFHFDPEEFLVRMEMVMDGNVIFSNSISARNPPPLCIPVPIPYIPIQIETCAKLYDIHVHGADFQVCFDFETKIEKATVLVLHFDCMRVGNNGVSLVKPGNDEGTTLTQPLLPPPHQPGADVFDPVTEVKQKVSN